MAIQIASGNTSRGGRYSRGSKGSRQPANGARSQTVMGRKASIEPPNISRAWRRLTTDSALRERWKRMARSVRMARAR